MTPAPAPVEAAPAPATTEVVVQAPAGSTMEITVEPTPPAPVVVTTPPPPVLSPPAPTWGPVRPTPPVGLAPSRVQQTIRSHRQSAVAAFAVGSLGMTAALGLQYARAQSLRRCLAQHDDLSTACSDAEAMSAPFGYYSAIGMGMFVAGTAGAGVMLGNAAATRDVQLRGGTARARPGLKLLGVAAIGAASAWMVAANLQLARHEAQCEDMACVARYRPLRWAANDGAALGIAAGAGMVGYAVAYERQGKALVRLRAAPSLGLHTGVSAVMEF